MITGQPPVAYDAFGNLLSADDPTTGTADDGDLPGTDGAYAPQRSYTGREPDAATGLIYYRARWYDPAIGRFISEDPIGFAAGDLNLTRYVGNNTPNATDPSGLYWFWNWDWSTFGEGYGNNLNPWGSSGQPAVDAGDRFIRGGQRGAVIVAGGAGGLAGGLGIAAGAGVTAIGTTSMSSLGMQVTAGATYYGTQACATTGTVALWLERRPAIRNRLVDGLQGYLESGGSLYDAAASMVFGSAIDGAPHLLGDSGRGGSGGLPGLGLPGMGRPSGGGASNFLPGPGSSLGHNPPSRGRRLGINPSTGQAEIIEGKLVDNGLSLMHDPVTQCSPRGAPNGATEMHHLLPQAESLQPYFKRAGLNIEDFKIPLDKARHRLKPDGIHTNSGGNWNKVWKEYFDVNPDASKSQILEQLGKMREQFGI